MLIKGDAGLYYINIKRIFAQMKDETKDLLTVAQYARLVNLTPARIYQKIWAGKIITTSIQKRIFIKLSENPV